MNDLKAARRARNAASTNALNAALASVMLRPNVTALDFARANSNFYNVLRSALGRDAAVNLFVGTAMAGASRTEINRVRQELHRALSRADFKS